MRKIKPYGIALPVGIILVVGARLLEGGSFVLYNRSGILGKTVTVSSALLGLGVGLSFLGLMQIANQILFRRSEKRRRRLWLEQTDERIVAINNCAKTKAFDVFTPIFGILMFVYAFTGMGLEAVVLLIVPYLLVDAVRIYYVRKLSKEM